MDRLVNMLKAAGDNTRLRLLLLLLRAELTVSELTQIIGQSQPRVSRHLKLLCEAGLLARFKEGAWVFYRAADRGEARAGSLIDCRRRSCRTACRRRAPPRAGSRGARGNRRCVFQGQCAAMG